MICRQFWSVSAFATAEEFRLEKLYAALAKTNVYEPTCLYKGSDEDETGELAESPFLYRCRNFLFSVCTERCCGKNPLNRPRGGGVSFFWGGFNKRLAPFRARKNTENDFFFFLCAIYEIRFVCKRIAIRLKYYVKLKVREISEPVDVIHAVSKMHVTNEPRHLYFFREGSVVGWNVADLEVQSLVNFLAEHEIGPYDDHVVMDEREIMYYTYTEDK